MYNTWEEERNRRTEVVWCFSVVSCQHWGRWVPLKCGQSWVSGWDPWTSTQSWCGRWGRDSHPGRPFCSHVPHGSPLLPPAGFNYLWVVKKEEKELVNSYYYFLLWCDPLLQALNSPLVGRGHGHRNRSPTREYQNSKHLICWKSSAKINQSMHDTSISLQFCACQKQL